MGLHTTFSLEYELLPNAYHLHLHLVVFEVQCDYLRWEQMQIFGFQAYYSTQGISLCGWSSSYTIKICECEPAFSQVSLHRFLHKWLLAQFMLFALLLIGFQPFPFKKFANHFINMFVIVSIMIFYDFQHLH